jgi:CBS domain-containing protein
MMKQFDTGVILVVENLINRKLVGIITDRDLILRLPHDRAPENMTVEECMTHGDLLCCKAEDDIEQVLKVMAKRHVRRVPVLSQDNRVEGVITDRILLEYAVEKAPELCLALAHVIASKTRRPDDINAGTSFP